MNYVFHKNHQKLAKNRQVVVDIGSVARLSSLSAVAFFKHLVMRLHRQLGQLADYRAYDLYEEVIQSSDFATSGLFEYLSAIKTSGIRVIFLLDEFDAIQKVFADTPEAFQTLREMGYDYHWKTSLVVTSRLGIGQIERCVGSISNLAGIFLDINLGLMSESECWELIQMRLQRAPLHFSDWEIAQLLAVAGQHPFFLEMLGFYLFDELANGNSTTQCFERAIERARGEMYKSFESFRTRMGSDRFNCLLETICGRSSSDLEPYTLVQLGHLMEKRNKQGGQYFAPFSQMYGEYLAHHVQRINRPAWVDDDALWDLLRETETGLRDIIQGALQRQYGTGWEEQLALVAKTMKLADTGLTVYDEWVRRREKERQTFQRYADVPTLSLLDYSYIGELAQIICGARWPLFRSIFGDKADLNKSLGVITRVRNPQAHFRAGVIPKNELDRAKVACRDILLQIELARRAGSDLHDPEEFQQ